ncbi:MAG: BatD family protein [Cytophagales bacterium]|nr:BatD family protein [Cytophagales bacterium]
MRLHLSIIVAFFAMVQLFAQDVGVHLGNNNISLNEHFTITIVIQNEQLRTYSPFPDIAGFQKRGISSQSSTNIINGQITFSQSIVQNYAPTKEGKFKLPPFTIEINGKKVQNPGTEIKVNPARQQPQNPFDADPFDQFFGGGKPREFVDVKEDAFFALTTNKDKVYVNEGFTMTLAFYVSKTNQAEMAFPNNIGNQISEILKKVKPKNCWEENFGIEQIQPEQVKINGKIYDEYKVFRATYYPLNKEPVKFPSVSLSMIKYKVAKTPSFFGMGNKQQDTKAFTTKPKTIIVKELPPHPLRDNVAVGIYKLEENASSNKFNTGKSFNYNFKISGEGNISALQNPISIQNKLIDIYPPNIYQEITRSGMAVSGSKNFAYFMVPKEPGMLNLKEYLYFIYFNPAKAKYDTLLPTLSMNIRGESSANQEVASKDMNDFMKIIEKYNNNLIGSSTESNIKLLINIMLGAMFLGIVVILFRK